MNPKVKRFLTFPKKNRQGSGIKKTPHSSLDKNHIHVPSKIMRDPIIIDHVGHGEPFGSFLCVLQNISFRTNTTSKARPSIIFFFSG